MTTLCIVFAIALIAAWVNLRRVEKLTPRQRFYRAVHAGLVPNTLEAFQDGDF